MERRKTNWWRFGSALALVLCCVLLLGFGHEIRVRHSTRSRTFVPAADAMRVVNMDLEGLTPERVERVRDCLLAVRGVQSVEFGTGNKEVCVTFDIARTDLTRIREALQAEGFTPYFH